MINDIGWINSNRIAENKVFKILLFPCNLLCYIRILLLLGAVLIPMALPWISNYQTPVLLTVSVLLDLVDGYLARRYNHQTIYGLVLDLVIDISTSTVIWLLADVQFGFIFIVLEWLAVAAILYASFCQPHGHWKTELARSEWPLVSYYFSNNQRNWLSAYGCIGHFVFPMTYIVTGSQSWLAVISFPGLLLFELTSIILIIAIVEKRMR